MKSTITTALLALASLTSAQYLSNQQYGTLPSCADNCPALTTPQQQCSANDWSCFCSGVWSQIQAAPSQICAQTCTNPSDVTQAFQWYTQNCGSDNGATAHGGNNNANSGSGGSNGNNNGGSGGSGTSSSSPSESSGATSSGSSSGEDNVPSSWWAGHWRWIVMVLVLFFGLLGLALLGLWLKKRHYRRRDQIRGGFNSGITERAPPEMSNANVAGNDASMLSNSNIHDTNVNGGRDSPVRTRDAFMPYGYGYTRSESRLGSNSNLERTQSPLARGSTPVGEIERGPSRGGAAGEDGATPSGKKSRRVLVRERSGADSSEDVVPR